MDNTKNDTTNANAIQTCLSFKLGNETFAADVKNVINILEMKPITKVPQSPDYIKGVINLRGNVLPVADMRIKFGLPEVEVSKDTCILVLHLDMDGEDVMIGAIVDSVNEVLEIESASVEPAPSIGTKYRPDFLTGMWKKDEQFIMILNIENVFTSDETIIMNEVGQNETSEELTN